MSAWPRNIIAIVIVFAGAAWLSACSGARAPEQKPLASDGPAWLEQPCAGLPSSDSIICGVGESDFAETDVEAAKVDAETAAKNRVADQLSAWNERLTERLNGIMKEAGGRPVGERTLKDINGNYQRIELTGLRFSDYAYYPSRLSPKKVFVRAVLSVDTNAASKKILDAMLVAAREEKLEAKHQDAQARLETARKQYIAEDALRNGAATQRATRSP